MHGNFGRTEPPSESAFHLTDGPIADVEPLGLSKATTQLVVQAAHSHHVRQLDEYPAVGLQNSCRLIERHLRICLAEVLEHAVGEEHVVELRGGEGR